MLLPASHNIDLTCRSTSQPSVTMSSRPATVLGDPSVLLPTMKVRSHHSVCEFPLYVPPELRFERPSLHPLPLSLSLNRGVDSPP